MEIKKQNKILTLLICFLLVSMILSVTVGSVSLSLGQLFSVLKGQASKETINILRFVRFPRAVAALGAGSGLAVAGVLLQGVLQNPMASPSVIGANAGAGLFYMIGSTLFYQSVGVMMFGAFLGAFLMVQLVLVISKRAGFSKISLILSGIAINSLCNACIDVLTTAFPDSMQASSGFRQGSLAGVTLSQIWLPCAVIIVCVLITYRFRFELDIYKMGEETAESLGLRVGRWRYLFLLLASVLAGASVSFAGLLGFVGLIIPHCMRLWLGEESGLLIIASAIGGGAFLLTCDVLARVVVAPFELPVGVLMSCIGAPFFIFLLVDRRRGRYD